MCVCVCVCVCVLLPRCLSLACTNFPRLLSLARPTRIPAALSRAASSAERAGQARRRPQSSSSDTSSTSAAYASQPDGSTGRGGGGCLCSRPTRGCCVAVHTDTQIHRHTRTHVCLVSLQGGDTGLAGKYEVMQYALNDMLEAFGNAQTRMVRCHATIEPKKQQQQRH